MVTSRRSFLLSSAAFLVAPYLRTFADQMKPRLCLGVLSDIHVREPGWTLDPFVKALRWFDAQKVDGVMIAGDLADFGMVEQLAHVGKAWDDLFANDRAADGRRVEKVFVTGNHDRMFHNHARMKKKYPDEKTRFERSISFDPNAAWQRCFHEEYRPVYAKMICGYSFVARHYSETGVGAFMAKEKQKIDMSKPFFFVQHQHPKDTCYGPFAWGHDDGKDSTNVLSRFPNAVAFSGHSHMSLTDEQSVWQGAFTSIGTASLRYTSARYGYENGENKKQKRTEEMPMFSGSSNQGLLMRVYDDRLVLERRDFEPFDNPKVGPDWTIPLPFSEPAPFDFAHRGSVFPVPEFAQDAAITVRRQDGPNRKKKVHPQVVVEFPVATAGKGRVFDYEVTVRAEGQEDLVRRVLSPTFANAPEKDGGTATCVFAASEVPRGATFVVTPRNSFGRGGHPLRVSL